MACHPREAQRRRSTTAAPLPAAPPAAPSFHAVACTSRILRPLAEADALWARLFAQRFPRLVLILERAQPPWWGGPAGSWRRRFAALHSGAPFEAQVYNREQGVLPVCDEPPGVGWRAAGRRGRVWSGVGGRPAGPQALSHAVSSQQWRC